VILFLLKHWLETLTCKVVARGFGCPGGQDGRSMLGKGKGSMTWVDRACCVIGYPLPNAVPKGVCLIPILPYAKLTVLSSVALNSLAD